MKVHHIITDLEKAFEMQSCFKDYSVSVAELTNMNEGTLSITNVQAFGWDDDEEFYLMPTKAAKFYSNAVFINTAWSFYEKLIKLPELREFEFYAKASYKLTSEGGMISVNSPVYGTRYHDGEKTIYFQYGEE